MTIRLYDLAATEDRRLSPFCWRTKYALAHKGLEFEAVPVGFGEIPNICGGKFKTVPIIEDGATAMNESWDIADYLDRTYPERPMLFASPGERAGAVFFDNWFGPEIMLRLFRMYVLDIHNRARPEDQPYVRESREKRLGGTKLEDFVANREALLPETRDALRPMRMVLAKQPWLGGATPNYMDYIALGGFLWAASVATLPPLEKDDMLHDWLARGFDLYGGLGRSAKTDPLAA
ncbi:MAG: glutathione S-transferase N-terminal domain-containing protein [Parvibaculum sp.]|uniref:glutathione S-transferase N-terminal domain-containing protein n=1 Tax=Parvibaculum sp. TaxID=2024848 RepID=UPI002719590B|nr:glutathione S-transferase N-terminal domain-containing protein [Parvibaculum sp.]MDO8838124.1 glutathione S-transferase N-terminal domain-containing protein [Parvibaculum sp.]